MSTKQSDTIDYRVKKNNTFFTAVVLILALPTALILASWDTLPGGFMYPVKTALEGATLIALSPTPFAPKFSVKFAERRFSEANKLLATQSSTVGYELLVQQAEKSKEIIIEKQDAQTAQDFLVKLEEYQKVIEEKQETFTGVKTPEIISPGTTKPSPIGQPTEPPRPRPESTLDKGVVCIQVITPAKNPATGECREFPTPCDVPSGWVKVASCPPPTQPQSDAKPVAQKKPTPFPVSAKIEHQKPEEIAAKLTETKQHLEKIEEEIRKEVSKADKDRDKDRDKEKHPSGERKNRETERRNGENQD